MSAIDSPPEGKTAEEYLAEAAADSAPGARRPSRSRSRTAPTSAPGASATSPTDPEVEPVKLTPAFKRLREGVLQIYTGAEMAAKFLDPEVSDMISKAKDDCADAWIDLAQRDTGVKNMLTKLTTGAGWSGVVMAHMTLVIPILAKRGWVPGGALFNGALMNRVTTEDMQAQEAFHRAEAVSNYAAGISPLGVVTVP